MFVILKMAALLWRAGKQSLIPKNLTYARYNIFKLTFQRYLETETSVEKQADEQNTFQKKKIERIPKISCGEYAKLADGCAVAEFGGTAVIATVVGKGEPSGLDIPLTVNYRQKAAAIGRIPTNFLRRDLGSSDSEMLTSRVIDRSVRPMFTPGYAIETQITCSPLALDGSNFPDILAINAASAALACSDIPWSGPIAATRVALIDNEVVVNPTKLELQKSTINLTIATTYNDAVVMIEGCCDNLPLDSLQHSFAAAVKTGREILTAIEDLQKKYSKDKRIVKKFEVPPYLKERVKELAGNQIKEILTDNAYTKLSRDYALKQVYELWMDKLVAEYPDCSTQLINCAFYQVLKELYKSLVRNGDVRCDGRKSLDVRPIKCKVGVYDALHGSSLFQRGETQVFCTVSLDSPNSALRLDNINMLTSGIKEKNFFVHYDFPAFATNEIKYEGRKNRREIGHGYLAENGLKYAIPDSFPFTIRLTSEVLESNGSSSMATVCGGTMALLDAGVPLKFEVAGVALGLLVCPGDGQSKIHHFIIDLMGMEDYLGDMDLKVAGSSNGITAIQMDLKIPGLHKDMVFRALSLARKSNANIIKKMNQVINSPRTESRANWPEVEVVTIPPQFRSKFIGLGGFNIKKLELEVGVQITEIEPGQYSIFAANKDAMLEVKQKIQEFLNEQKEPELEFGAVYTATVVEVRDNGCMVKLFPSMTPAFIGLSQLDNRRVAHPNALGFDVGSEFSVKYFGREPGSGNMRLSRKVLLVNLDN